MAFQLDKPGDYPVTVVYNGDYGVTLVFANGGALPIRWKLEPLLDGNGKPTGKLVPAEPRISTEDMGFGMVDKNELESCYDPISSAAAEA